MEIQEQYLETKNNEVINEGIQNIPIQRTYNLEVVGGRYVAQVLHQELVQQDVNQEKVSTEKQYEEEEQNETGEIVLNEEKQLEMGPQKTKSKLTNAIILAEKKHLIVKKQTVVVSEYIITQRMNELCELVNQSKEELAHLENEDKILDTKMNLLPKGISTLQERVENGKKIFTKLKGIFEKLQNDYKEYTQDTEDIKTKHTEHKKEASLFINDVSSKFLQIKDLLKQDIEELEKCSQEKRKSKEEGDKLQKQIFEQRKCLQTLKDHDVELTKRGEKVDIMEKENKEKRDILKKKQEDLMKLKEKNKEIEERRKHEIELLNTKLKEREESVSNQYKLMEELNNKAEQLIQEHESAKLILASKQSHFDKLVKQKIDAEEKLKSAKGSLELLKKTNEDELIPLKVTHDGLEETIKIKEEELISLKMELESVKNEQTKELKKKTLLIQEKCERDKKIATKEMLLGRLKDLKTKFEEKTKKKEIFEEKIKKLTDDSPLQELQKDKAYLEASLNHLDDKLIEAKTQADEVAKEVEENEEKYNNLQKSISEKRAEIEALKLKSSDDQKSILKPETVPKNDTFKSPKRVKFNSLMEVKSLSSVDTIESSSQEEHKAPNKLLEEIFQNLQKKQNAKPAKRRIVEFDE